MINSRLLKKTCFGNNTLDFSELVNKYYKKAYSVAYSKTNNREDAEDLVQETFLRALRFFDSYNKEISFETWLYKIMSNINIDNYRKSFKAKNPNIQILSLDQPIETNEGEVAAEIPDYSEDPSLIMEEKHKKQSVIKALNSLKPEFREALYLCDIEGKSYEEIAQITNINIGTVRSRIFRARQEIKEKLQG